MQLLVTNTVEEVCFCQKSIPNPQWAKITKVDKPEFMFLLQYLDSLKMPPFTDCWLGQNALPNVSSLIYSVSHSMSPKFSLASLILSSNFASRPVFGTRLVMVDLVLLAAVTEVP